MGDKKTRYITFFSGASIGLLLGATAMYFSLNNQKKDNEISDNVIERLASRISGLISVAPAKKEAVITPSKTASQPIVETAEPGKEVIQTNDSVTREFTHAKDDFAGNENIIVKKDELKALIISDVINLSPRNKSTRNSDSLIENLSGVQGDLKLYRNYKIAVEFWESPINYKGYKLSENKLILFGIGEEAEIKLYYLLDFTYLRYMDQVYRLDKHSDFKPFERVTQVEITNALK